jgi:polyisoprenoid-binding protein YceI
MKRYLLAFFTTLALIFGFSSFVQAADTYTLDPNHTYVLWHINHFGFSNPSGKWMAQGTLILDQANPQNSKVNVTIQIANLVTGVPELDAHLKEPLFFDAAKFPTATFVSDKVDVTGKNTAKVHGMLTVHGVTKPIVLNVTLNKIGINPINNKQTAGFSATATLDRSDYGITTLIPDISDLVKINIEMEANKSS